MPFLRLDLPSRLVLVHELQHALQAWQAATTTVQVAALEGDSRCAHVDWGGL